MDSSIAMQIIKRLIYCILIIVFLLFCSNIAWLIVWCQYGYETVEELNDSEYYIDKAEKSKDKEDEKIYYENANDEIKHAGYLVNMAKRKT